VIPALHIQRVVTLEKKINTKRLCNKVNKTIRDLNIGFQDSDAAAVLLASATLGPNCRSIAGVMGIPLSIVRKYGRMARKYKIWYGSKLDVEWDDKQHGTISFIMDTLVVTGKLKRRSVDKDGHIVYRGAKP
jgi:hypothetical protein